MKKKKNEPAKQKQKNNITEHLNTLHEVKRIA